MSRLSLVFCLTLLSYAVLACGNDFAISVAHAAEPTRVAILPETIRLSSPLPSQQLLVQRMAGDVSLGPVAEGQHVIQWTVANPEICSVEEGRIVAKANGQTTLTATIASKGEGAAGEKVVAQAQVTVEDFDPAAPWNFRNHVQSVLSKTGCNMGACHGAVAGKNGFRLSLRGYDPEGDYFLITRHARGRRITPHDPGRSLLLTKPTGAIAHKGGVRFTEDSPEYRVISQWIAQGHPGPVADEPRITRLQVYPSLNRLQAGVKQQLLVMAEFTDGRREDVTRWAKFTATNHAVCTVVNEGENQGLVTVNGSGEGSIVAWYLAQNVIATVTVPLVQDVPPQAFARKSELGKIDELILAKLEELNIPPSPPCSDSEFLRRLSLDLLGVLPTADEAEAFLASNDPDKRTHLVDRLLVRPEFVDYWTYRWSDLLLVSGDRLRPDAVKAYSAWIREQVEKNTPWDQIARGVILAKGSTITNGAANFYALHQDPLDMSETVSTAFLGMSINCARCHDHPLEKWTNDEYYGMASLFARVRGKGWGGDFRAGDGNRTIFLADRGEVIQPRTGEPQLPKPLDGEAIAFDAEGDRREHLAQWLTARENPYFSRAIVNRVWANFMGTGLVEAVDDLRLTNPASNEALLNYLANDLVDHQYDLRQLMRQIVLSDAYGRSSQSMEENAKDDRYYSHFRPRRLSAEVMLDALSQVTAVPTEFKDYPAGTRALQLKDAAVGSYFLSTFGRPARLLTCECERTEEPSMTQVLHLMNGDTLMKKLESDKCVVNTLFATGKDESPKTDSSPENSKEAAPASANTLANRPDLSGPELTAAVTRLYLSAFSRYPSGDELRQIHEVIDQTPISARPTALQDLLWSLLTSREFLFQH